MDHRYIDEHSVAGRYLDHQLPTGQRAEFEAHLVDCKECTDRILLAEMFHSRNGIPKPKPPEPPTRMRIVIPLSPRRFSLLLAAGTVVLLILAPSLLLLWIKGHTR